jgi:uncharacterized membrane protein YidH (DUF202 family)
MTPAPETQPARTALAWQRTGLGMLLVAGLLARSAVLHEELLLVLPTAVVALAGLAVLGVVASRRQRAAQAAAAVHGDARASGAVRLATALVVLTGACALAADLVAGPR